MKTNADKGKTEEKYSTPKQRKASSKNAEIEEYLLTSSMRHPNYNSLIDNLKKRLDGEVFLGKK